MRILVGVLYSGEPQYERCIAAIAAQQHTDWELLEIKNQPNREAHQQLFDTFNRRAKEFDLFVKIDADMELCRNDFFTALVDYFEQHPQIKHLTMKVDDYFTGRLIWGLNAFRSSVTFAQNDRVYTDMAVNLESSQRAHLRRHPQLVPAAKHSYDPTAFQAFYFGCHKAIKVMHRQSRSHWRNINRLLLTGIKKRDKRLLIAYAGAAIAFERDLQPDCLDHDNGTLQSVFTDLQHKDKRFWFSGLLRHFRIIRAGRSRFLSNTR